MATHTRSKEEKGEGNTKGNERARWCLRQIFQNSVQKERPERGGPPSLQDIEGTPISPSREEERVQIKKKKGSYNSPTHPGRGICRARKEGRSRGAEKGWAANLHFAEERIPGGQLAKRKSGSSPVGGGEKEEERRDWSKEI